MLAAIERTSFRREGARASTSRKAADQQLDASDSTSNHADRIQCIREARWMEENNTLVKSILRKYRKFVVGRLQYVARTSNEAVNTEINAYVERWMKHADRCGKHHFRTLAGLGVTSMKRDGDIGFITSEVKPTPLETALKISPIRLQPIEADRIGAPHQSGQVLTKPFRPLKKGEQVMSGVVVDAEGRPTRYLVHNRVHGSANTVPWRDIDASDFILLYDPTRLDGYRGFSSFDAAFNDLKDGQEILACEKASVKYLSSVTAVVKNETGESPSDVSLDTTHASYNADAQNLKAVQPGTIEYLQEGQDFKALEFDRPTPTFSGFMETLIRSGGLSVDLPFGFIYSWAGQGTAVRMEAAQAAREFEQTQLVLEEKLLDPIIRRVIARGIQLGHLPNIPDFDAGEWRYPAKPTADVGRESKALIEEVMAGITSRTQVAADRGEDYGLIRGFRRAEALHVIEDAKQLVAASGGEIDLKLAIYMIERRGANAPAEPAPAAAPADDDSED